MESSWAQLRKNVLDQHRWTTRQDLRLAIVVLMKPPATTAPQDRLGGLTPIEFETKFNRSEAIAAETTTVT